jgi:hypothetical protein
MATEELTSKEIKALTELKNSAWTDKVVKIYGNEKFGYWYNRQDHRKQLPEFLCGLLEEAYQRGREDLRNELCKLIGARR